jgi:hypothetical protein
MREPRWRQRQGSNRTSAQQITTQRPADQAVRPYAPYSPPSAAFLIAASARQQPLGARAVTRDRRSTVPRSARKSRWHKMSSSHQATITQSASAPRCTMTKPTPGRHSVRAGWRRRASAVLVAERISASSGKPPPAVIPMSLTVHDSTAGYPAPARMPAPDSSNAAPAGAPTSASPSPGSATSVRMSIAVESGSSRWPLALFQPSECLSLVFPRDRQVGDLEPRLGGHEGAHVVPLLWNVEVVPDRPVLPALSCCRSAAALSAETLGPAACSDAVDDLARVPGWRISSR